MDAKRDVERFAELSALEAHRDSLYQQLEEGYSRIEKCLDEGADITTWEDLWLALHDEYERVCEALQRDLMRGAMELNERGALATKTLPDGRIVDVSPLGWGYALLGVIRVEDLGLGIYSDVWQYQSRSDAVAALEAWDGEGEPPGWYRHIGSGRRRPGGDPQKEFIRE